MVFFGLGVSFAEGKVKMRDGVCLNRNKKLKKRRISALTQLSSQVTGLPGG